MMKFFKNLFASPALAEEIDPQIAATALLVEAALIDGVYVNLESDMIAEILLEAFSLDADSVDALIEKGEELAEAAIDAHKFTKHVKTLEMQERVAIVEGLYRVVLADGEKSDVEDSFVRQIASLLHVDDVSRARARQRAEARIAAAS